MTARVSLFPTPASQSAGEATVPAPAAETKSAAAPFSRMLDHAVRENPSRNQKPTRADRSAPKETKVRSSDTTETDRAEAKPDSEARPARVKSGKRDQETAENQNLADACNTTTPVAPKLTEETTVASVEVEASATAAVVAEGQEAEGKVATTSSETNRTTAKLATSAETTASAGLDVTALMTPVEAADAEAVSLLNTLTPTATTESSNATPNTAADTNKAAAVLLQTTAPTETKVAEPTTMATPVEIPLEQVTVTELQNFSAPPDSPTATSIEATNVAVVTEFSPANIATDSGLATTAAQSAATLTNPVGSTDVTVSSATAAIATSASAATATAPEDVRRSVRAARLARLEGLENAAGTGGAKSSPTMKTAIKKEEIAGNAEQFLPVASPNAVSALRNLPGDLNRAATGQFSSPNSVEAAGSTNTTTHGTDPESLFVRSNSPMNRISEVISREIRMFKRGGDDLVEVVLTPDTKTQISLRLQWRDGQVEVQARCDLGNYQSLNTEWPQLQQSLANHGVRLSHLSERVPTGFTEFFNNPSFAQQHRREESSQSHAGAADAIPALPTPGKPSATPIVRRGGGRFDSWA